jgi:hypothetical protein
VHGQLGQRARYERGTHYRHLFTRDERVVLRRPDDDFNRALRKRNARGMIFKEEERKKERKEGTLLGQGRGRS